MSDVIKDAKRLLDGTTPAPWEHYNDHGIISLASGDTPIATDLNAWDADLIAAAPELAQELAEDSYEYIVQVHCEGRWQFYIGENIRPTDKPGLSVGFLQEKYAREFAKIETEYPTRLVRRRVSPVEVVNDNRFTR